MFFIIFQRLELELDMAWTTRRRGTGDRERDRELEMAWTTRRRGTGDRERLWLRLRLLERLRLLRTGCLEDLLQDIEG
jgi:hypothetical protein